MNRTKIAAVATAVGATLAAASSAWAITPANLPAALANANSIVVPFSGATATDGVLLRLFHKSGAGQICVAGTIDYYFVGNNTSNNRVFTCQTNDTLIPALDTTAGLETRNVIFYKESIGGSGNGSLTVADATPLTFLNLSALAAAASCQTGAAGADPGLAYTERTNCAGTGTQVPLAGISDVDPAVNLANQTQIDNLTTSPAVQVVFGVPVSLNAYRALQTAQGLANTDDRATIPSLTSSQITALYTGFISNWNQLTGTGDVATALASHPVFVCRRGQTSGTQASAEAVFLGQRCITGVTEFVSPNDGSDAIAGSAFNGGTQPSTNPNQNVYAGSGSGQVRQCMDFHNDGGRWAVGVLSTENIGNNSDRQYRFVRVDGAEPALDEVVNGSYKYFTENTINWRNGAGVGSVPNFQQQALLDHVVANVGDPDTIAGINLAFQRNATGNPVDGGLLAKPELFPVVSGSNEAEYSETEVRAYPVNSQTRRNNNCQPAIVNFDAVTPIGGNNDGSIP